MNTTEIDIFLGLDVGKTDHWGCAVTVEGTTIWNKTLPNDEAKLTKVYQDLSAQGHRPGGRGPASDHRCLGRRGGPAPGHHRGLSARADHATDRGHVSGYGHNRRKGCVHYR